jgi:hypothetical protein
MIPDPTIVFQHLADCEIAVAFVIRKANHQGSRHQVTPAREIFRRMNVMLPALSVDVGIDVYVSEVIAMEVMAHRELCHLQLPSFRTLALPSAILCHCMLPGESAPPHSNRLTWSIT